MPPEPPQATLSLVTAIAISDLHKTYGRGKRAVTALAGVDLDVEPGTIQGLLGRNGAGKTTLVKILLDIGEGLTGRLLTYDGLSQEFRTLRVGRDPECPACADERLEVVSM